jgi:glycosyltransferase 2 family protein
MVDARSVEEGRTTGRRAWAWRLASLAISLVALAVVLASVDLAAAWAVLTDASVPIIVVALGVVGLQVVLRGWRWRIVLPERPDGSTVPVRRTIMPLLVGYLGNAILPARLGEPVRAVLVARREGLDPFASFGATMLERLIDVVTLALVGLVAAVALGASWWIVALAAAATIGGLVGLAVLVLLGLTRFVDLFASLLSRVGLEERTVRLQRWARSFAGGVDRGRDLVRLGKAIALSLVAWVLDASIFLLVGRSLGIELGIAEAALIGAVSVLATAIPAAPGYVGTFELAATTTAAALGVPRPEALALALLVHVVTLVPLALAGACALLASGLQLGRLATQAEEVEHGTA